MPTFEDACEYFSDRRSSQRIAYLPQYANDKILESLMQMGFRRSGQYFYQKTCDLCQECVGLRIPLQDFQLSQSQKRLLKKNASLEVSILQPQETDYKTELYLEYQKKTHLDTDSLWNNHELEKMLQTMRQQVYTHPNSSRELCVSLNGNILGVILLDIVGSSVSAVYSFYDPAHKQKSLGTYLVLQSLLWATKEKIEYFYMGLYLQGHKKMNYKNRFRPYETLNIGDSKWKKACVEKEG